MNRELTNTEKDTEFKFPQVVEYKESNLHRFQTSNQSFYYKKNNILGCNILPLNICRAFTVIFLLFNYEMWHFNYIYIALKIVGAIFCLFIYLLFIQSFSKFQLI